MNNADASRIAAQLRDKALIDCIGELARHGKCMEALSLVNQLTLADRNEVIMRHALSSTSATPRSAVGDPPDDPQTLFNLALSHHQAGESSRAIQLYQQILESNSKHVSAWQNLGTLRNAQRDVDGALEAYHNAIALDPRNAALRANFAEILRRAGDLEAAYAEASHAVALQPDYYHAHFNCAIIEAERGNIDNALTHYHKAAELDPAHPQPHEYMGTLKLRMGNNFHAEQHFRDAMTRDPADPKPHFGLALTLLAQGRLSEGWREWDFRIQCDHFETGLLRTLRGQEWHGEPLTGKRILVVTEQGFGDSFMFARYLPWLQHHGATVLLLCQPALIEVMRGCPYIDLLIAKPDDEEPDIAYDYYVWMMSLPVRHATTYATLLNSVPYLRADPIRVAKWKPFLAAYPGFKVGIVWAGNPHNRLDSHRTIPFSKLAPLLSVPNTTFFSLQCGNSSQDTIVPLLHNKMVDVSSMLDLEARFVDTAAIMEILDLIITVDTSTCHLAGALGRPVWTLLAKVCDWRWTETGNESPWYPTMRLFRQTQLEGWDEVIERVTAALTELVKERIGTVDSRHTAAFVPKTLDLVPSVPTTDPIALCRKATRLHRGGQIDQAIHFYRAALDADPNHWETRHLLGLAYHQKGDVRRALKHILKALEQYPDYADAHNNLGLVYESLNDDEQATTHYQRALEIDPKHLEAHINIGGLKYKQGETRTALHYFNSALRLNHRSSQAHNNIGVIQLGLGHTHRAMEHFESALAIDPHFADAHNNLGNALKQLGRLENALEAYQRAIEYNATLSVAHWNRSLIWLSQGRFDVGWDAYEWGRRCGERQAWPLPQPEWDGAALSGKRILLYAEQGVGDELFFARFLTPVLQQAIQVKLYCDPRLIPLLSRAFPTLECVPKTNRAIDQTNIPPVDYTCPLGSLPRHLCRSVSLINSFPAAYLIPNGTRVELWRERYRALGSSLKVGIAWRGGKSADQQRLRSIPLAQWQSLLKHAGVDFISLQHGDCQEEMAQFAAQTGISLHTWPDTDPLSDLDDFAAQIAALDLVIAVDNSTVHLAGALGKETWILAPIAGDFRWQTQGNNTPWYPTARLVRQTKINEWHNEFEDLTALLHARTESVAATAHRLDPVTTARTASFLESPILVVGAPRSGTSLLTGVLEHCGAWLGETIPGDEPNPKGYFENELLRDLNKQVLADLGWDPLGVDPLPQTNPPALSTFREAVIHRLRHQGYSEQVPWVFKCVKTPLLWPLWHAAFPRARWIIVHRDPSEVVQSCLRSPFFKMRRYDQAGWQQWLARFQSFLTDLRATVNFCREISAAEAVHGDTTTLHTLVTDLGLDWNDTRIRTFIDPTLWRRQDYLPTSLVQTTPTYSGNAAIHTTRDMALAAQFERQAYSALLADDLDQSDELCRRWLATDPLSDEAYRLLGSSACQQREWQRAIEYFRTALEYRPASAQLHYNLGVALFQCGRYGEAVVSYELATAIKPGYVEAWENLATSLAAAGQHHRAAEVYRQLLHTAPFRVANQQALTTLEQFLVTHS